MGAKSATPASVPSAPQSGGDYATKSVAPRMAAVSAAPKAMLLVDPLDAAAPEETAPAGPPTAPGQSPSAGRAPVADVFDAAPEPTNPGIRSMRMDAARAQRSVQALARRGLVDAQALDAALEEVGARGGRVLEHLVTRGTIDEGTIADVLAQDAGCARLPDDALRTRTPPGALMRRLPHTYLLARRVLPLSFEDGTVVVVMADPHDAGTLDELRSILNAQRVDRVVASRSAITNATIAMVRSLGMGGDSLTQGNAPRALLCMSDDGKAARLGARLAGEGIRIEHVVDGETARHILTTRPPDVVLCAHDIAGVSVTALLLAARSNGPTEELPFYVFGPRGNDELATSVLELGADDFFGEPIKDDLVLAKVRRAVGKTRTLHPEPVVLPDPGPPPPAPGLPDMAAVLSEQTPMVALAPEPADIGPSSERDDALLSGAPLLDEGFDELPDLPDFDLLDPNEGTPAMPTGVMGTLRQMSLSDIVQSLELGRKTARVEIVPTLGEKGMVAFDDGQVRFAECGLLTSDEAFFQLARHTEGFFRIHYGNKPPSVNVHSPTTLLLLEAMRRMDEGKGNG